jgi:uncharacterized protein with HEPN domain
MSRDLKLCLEDIIEVCDLIASYVQDFDFARFQQDSKTRDAVIRQFEIVGEAVKGLPERLRAMEPNMEWREIAGFRDVLAHAYFAVDLSIVWDAAMRQAPSLRAACQRLRDQA